MCEWIFGSKHICSMRSSSSNKKSVEGQCYHMSSSVELPKFRLKKIPKEILGQILFSDCSGYQDPRAQNQKPIKNQPSWSASKWPSIRWSNPKSSICQVLGRGEKQPKHMPCQFRNMDAKKPPGKCSVPFSLVKLMKINDATDVFQALCFWTTGRWDTLKIPNPVVKHHAAKKQTSAKNKPQEAHKMMNNFFVGRWMCNINGFFFGIHSFSQGVFCDF